MSTTRIKATVSDPFFPAIGGAEFVVESADPNYGKPATTSKANDFLTGNVKSGSLLNGTIAGRPFRVHSSELESY